MNPAERRIQTAKSNTNKLMDCTGTPKLMWLHCMIYAVAILNMTCMDRLKGRNAHEVAFGHSLDISAYIQYSWWEKVHDTKDPSFPRSKEKLGHFYGVAENVGDFLTFQIYVPSSHQVIHSLPTTRAQQVLQISELSTHTTIMRMMKMKKWWN